MPFISNTYSAGEPVRMQLPDGGASNSSGMVLVVVVILAAVAGVLAAGLHYASGAKITQIRQEMRFEKAFFVAEAGIERAKSELLDRATNLNQVFIGDDNAANTADDGLLFGGATNYGEGQFYVRVWNNTNADPNPFVDTDHFVVIRSTGTVETAMRVIELEVEVMPTLAFTSMPVRADGGMCLYGTNTELIVKGSGRIDGNDWHLPSTLGGNDEVVSTNTAMPGVFYTQPETSITQQNTNSIAGNPPITNGVGMDNEADLLQFLADIAPTNLYVDGDSLGTREAPRITMLSGDVTFNGSRSGAGILIVPGDATLKINGTFDYEGLIIIMGNGIVDMGNELEALGTGKVLGAIICVGGELGVKVQGTFDLKYSTEALENLALIVNLPPQMPAHIGESSWAEIKASSAKW